MYMLEIEVARMCSADPARIGPNAIIQTVAALRDHYGIAPANALLAQSGQSHLIEQLPTEMVPESEFHVLVQALASQIGAEQVVRILDDAGQRTADYLLTHRIPRFFQRLVRVLPRRIGLWLLLKAISQHAWTFVGSGQFRFAVTHHPTLQLKVTYPSVSPVASFYGGTFTHLIHTLIDQRATVQTSTSQDTGGILCLYTLTLS